MSEGTDRRRDGSARPVLHWEPAKDRAAPVTTRGRRTCEAIGAATVRVLERMDLSEASVLDIAAEAGVATGTVYRYYVDKHDIIKSLLARVEMELIRYTQSELPRRPDGSLSIREGALAFLRIYRQFAPLFGVWTKVEPGTELAESWNRSRQFFISRVGGAVRRGQQDGLFRASADPVLVAELLMAASERSNYVRVVLGWGDATDDEVADGLALMFGEGLA